MVRSATGSGRRPRPLGWTARRRLPARCGVLIGSGGRPDRQIHVRRDRHNAPGSAVRGWKHPSVGTGAQRAAANVEQRMPACNCRIVRSLYSKLTLPDAGRLTIAGASHGPVRAQAYSHRNTWRPSPRVQSPAPRLIAQVVALLAASYAPGHLRRMNNDNHREWNPEGASGIISWTPGE
jgi:hypothetical protein